MKYLHLVCRNLMRRKLRTTFTFLSIVVAFVLFAYLSAIGLGFSSTISTAGQKRLVILNKITLMLPLPMSYQSQVAAVSGVAAVTHATWFGVKYQNHDNAFSAFPVEPASYLGLFPELIVPEEQRQAWFADRSGALVGRNIAERYDWKLGDRVPVQSTIWRQEDGSSTWDFTIRGIYDATESGVDKTMFLFHYDYFNEARSVERDKVGWYIVEMEDPGAADRVAKTIDARFANSSYETETMPEKALMQSFTNQIGNVGAILRAVLAAVFFTILLVAGNAMAQAVRERTSELAVLKTLGFSDGRVLALVLAESLLLALFAGAIGIGLGWLLIGLGGDPTNMLPLFDFTATSRLVGLALALGLGLVAGLLPAIQAMRLRIVDALRRV